MRNLRFIALNALVYGLPLWILSVLPFSKGFYGAFNSFLFNALFYGTVSYSTLGIIFDFLFVYCFLLLFRKEILIEQTRTYLIFQGFGKILRFIFIDNIKKPLIISQDEKVSLLFYLVKIVFTPVMINFAIGNVTSLLRGLNTFTFELSKINFLNSYLHLAFYVILVIDTFIFAFGYLIESKTLKSVVKSVEPTAFGWIIALMCYPPFNDLTGRIFGWYSADFSDFKNLNITLIATTVSIVFFAIYVWASIALGFKASNLTNRGIVSKGPYKYVRHPAYISKNASWWIMAIPAIQAFGFIAILSLTAWTIIYYLRALTEERHLSQDPDYIEYVKKVRYMFIPGII